MHKSKSYVPERNHIVWIDFEPTKGKEIGKYRPALVLSSREYNLKTGLLICCPISSSMRGTSTEIAIDNVDKCSVVVANLIQTFAWKERKVKFLTEAKEGILEEVLLKLIPLIGGEYIIQQALLYAEEDMSWV